jgi:uncharacterized protein DUF4403
MRVVVGTSALNRAARWAGVLAVAIGLLAGCGGSMLSIPRPTDSLAPPPAPPVLEASRLSLLVELPPSRLSDLAADTAPLEFGGEDAWITVPIGIGPAGLEVQYHVWREGWRFEMVQDRLVTRLDLRYRVRGRLIGGPVLGQCGHDGEEAPRLRIVASSTLAWTEGWGLRPTTAVAPPEFVDPCRALPGGIDATPLMQRLMTPALEAGVAALDARIAERAVSRERVTTIWDRLATPLEVAPGAWLALRPRAAQAGPIVGTEAGTLRTVVELIAQPIAKIDAAPDPEHRPLPDLARVASPPSEFHVALPVRVPYAALNKRLAETVVGTSVDVGGGRTLSVAEIQAYGSGPQVILQVGLSGAARGFAYLAGTPAIDPESRTLRFDGLQFSLESDSALVRATGRLLHRTLVAQLESRARLPLGAQIDTLRAQLGAALNRELAPGVDLAGSVDRLDLRGVYPIQDGLEAVVVFGGALRLNAR